MDEQRLRVVMLGSPRTAYAFTDLMQQEGLTAEAVEVPLEERSGGAIQVARYVFEAAGAASLLYSTTRAVIKKLRELFPGIDVEIEDDTPDD